MEPNAAEIADNATATPWTVGALMSQLAYIENALRRSRGCNCKRQRRAGESFTGPHPLEHTRAFLVAAGHDVDRCLLWLLHYSLASRPDGCTSGCDCSVLRDISRIELLNGMRRFVVNDLSNEQIARLVDEREQLAEVVESPGSWVDAKRRLHNAWDV
jgi:hypothetical protein